MSGAVIFAQPSLFPTVIRRTPVSMPSSPSTSFFSLPLALWQQPTSYRITKYESRKRRQDSEEEEGGESGVDDDDIALEHSSTRPSTPGSSTLILSPNEAHQYRIAGLSFDSDLPGGNFPHAPPPSDMVPRITSKDVDISMSNLEPPIYEPKPASRNRRVQHLSVITAILHRCLLEGDYIRAGRAWGLILRDEFGGLPVDVRNQGRWGIGAEILLRRGVHGNEGHGDDTSHIGSSLEIEEPLIKPWFTRKGFEEAKDYYERLILQYPYRRSAPGAIGPLDFYPAMFGLWIYIVQEESISARTTRGTLENQWDGSDAGQDDMSIPSDFSTQGKEKGLSMTQIRERELKEAQEIASRMDEIMVSPPYSDSVELLRLRGMVSLWIGDLYLSVVPNGGDHGSSERSTPEPVDDTVESSFVARQQSRLALGKKAEEVEKANKLFKKAKQRTKGVSLSLEGLHIG